MRIRIALLAALLVLLLPNLASAGPGILLLADEGAHEWNSLVTQLAAAVDRQTPTEVAFAPAATPRVQSAVDRLVQRGVSDIVIVPLFAAGPSADASATLKSPVPIRIASPLNRDPVVADILLDRAQAVGNNPAAEVLILIAHRAGADKRWVPDLAVAAQQLNRGRRFALIMMMTVSPDAPDQVASDRAAMRGQLERQIASARRILVVPVLSPYGSVEPTVKEWLEGFPHDVAESALMPDERLVAWILARAEGK